MNEEQRISISKVVRKLCALSSLLEDKPIEFSKNPEDEVLNWALSKLLKDIAEEVSSIEKLSRVDEPVDID